MQVFATRVWGFDPVMWPAITFAREGDRRSLLGRSRPGDRVVFVGTKSDEVSPDDRGRVLGMAEIGRTEVNTSALLAEGALQPEHLDENGHLRWPRALPMVRAWRFIDRPEVVTTIGRQLTQYATSGAELLNDEEGQELLNLRHEEVALPLSDTLSRERQLVDTLTAGQGPTTGPQPSAWQAAVEHGVDGPAFTYVFRFGQTDLWKVGWSQDLLARLSEVNQHIPTEVLAPGSVWTLRFQQRHGNHGAAYAMEQRVLGRLSSFRTQGERVRCSVEEIQRTWAEAVRG